MAWRTTGLAISWIILLFFGALAWSADVASPLPSTRSDDLLSGAQSDELQQKLVEREGVELEKRFTPIRDFQMRQSRS